MAIEASPEKVQNFKKCVVKFKLNSDDSIKEAINGLKEMASFVDWTFYVDKPDEEPVQETPATTEGKKSREVEEQKAREAIEFDHTGGVGLDYDTDVDDTQVESQTHEENRDSSEKEKGKHLTAKNVCATKMKPRMPATRRKK